MKNITQMNDIIHSFTYVLAVCIYIFYNRYIYFNNRYKININAVQNYGNN